MKAMGLALVFAVTVTAGVAADQLSVTGKTREGTFQGYDNSRFLFMSVKGRFMKEHASRVIKLVLEAPQRVAFTTAENPKEQTASLKGYDKKKFIFKQKDGKEIQVPLAKLKTLEMIGEETAGSQVAGVEGSGRYPIPKISVDTLAAGNPTPAQQAVIDKFSEAKKAYDAFLAESSVMVAQMDKQTGAKREESLNQLRMRKADEQPLKNNLVTAYKALQEALAES